MTTTTELLPSHLDVTRLAIASFLARYREPTRTAYTQDLKAYLGWCQQYELDVLRVSRGELEMYVRHLDGRGYAAATIARRFGTVATFYEYAVAAETALLPVEGERVHEGFDGPIIQLWVTLPQQGADALHCRVIGHRRPVEVFLVDLVLDRLNLGNEIQSCVPEFRFDGLGIAMRPRPSLDTEVHQHRPTEHAIHDFSLAPRPSCSAGSPPKGRDGRT